METTSQTPNCFLFQSKEVDSDGDLTLLVGPDKVRLLVSSKVLTLASKVFRTMLRPIFKEGVEFEER